MTWCLIPTWWGRHVFLAALCSGYVRGRPRLWPLVPRVSQWESCLDLLDQGLTQIDEDDDVLLVFQGLQLRNYVIKKSIEFRILTTSAGEISQSWVQAKPSSDHTSWPGKPILCLPPRQGSVSLSSFCCSRSAEEAPPRLVPTNELCSPFRSCRGAGQPHLFPMSVPTWEPALAKRRCVPGWSMSPGLKGSRARKGA